jgi:uncharacterized oxidoreductase
MDTKGNKILITGGATGIGLELAKLLYPDNELYICGRRKEKLEEAKLLLPKIHIMVGDVRNAKNIVEWAKDINVLINNAGIQKPMDLSKPDFEEIDINLKAPIELSALFIPLLKEKDSAIINVTSGLAFVPISRLPLYCATKAAMHSYTLSLRHQLKDTKIKVFEIIPPTVDTDLGQRRSRIGIPPDIIAKATLEAMKNDQYEIAIEQANNLKDPNKFQENFNRMNP